MLRLRLLVILVIALFSSALAQRVQLDSLVLALKTAEDDSLRVMLLNEIAFNNISINPLVAKDDVTIAYNAAKEMEFVRGQARSLAVMGGVYWGFGNYEQALLHYLDALKEYQKLDDLKGRSDCLNNIGEVYKKLGEYQNSLDYLKHALSLKEKLYGVGGSPLSNSNLGELYTLMGQYDSAEENYNIAIAGAQKLNDQRVLAYAYDGLGLIHFKQNNYSRAIKYFELAVNARLKSEDVRGLSYVYTNLGRTYMALNQLDSSEQYFRKGLKSAESASASDVKINLLKYLSEVDSLNEDYARAYYHYKKHAQLKDSVFNLEKSAQLARIQTEYETEILQKDNEAKKADVKQKNTMIIAVIMLLILTIALANAFYNQRTVQKQANKSLQSKSEQIAKQADELQTQSVKLQQMNENLESSNQNLEEKIRQRTEQLREQNKVLSDYAFFHAHELRAPVANILGLIELLKHSELPKKDADIVSHLFTSTTELDKVIRDITTKVGGNGEIGEIKPKD
ncbi:tetratricopeptide repeat protein [Fulvivirga lutimaris]|uniref:tetratricopeptide repeat protein n=1 Tax=Fulvivirga lutimaris TaxID=1819566 RepID=UPI0012BC6783|nr:tetratricopeptide repeat protein [Fulvivirga lutimaris]MTI41421.1 tetratricopeptide repeat protein [Fulvivirga lutimaris]